MSVPFASAICLCSLDECLPLPIGGSPIRVHSYSYDDDVYKVAATPEGSHSILWHIAPAIGAAGFFAMWILTSIIRNRIRKRDGIPPTVCACEDPFISFCCMCCVQSQLMRHEGLVHGRYHLNSPDGVSAGAALV